MHLCTVGCRVHLWHGPQIFRIAAHTVIHLRINIKWMCVVQSNVFIYWIWKWNWFHPLFPIRSKTTCKYSRRFNVKKVELNITKKTTTTKKRIESNVLTAGWLLSCFATSFSILSEFMLNIFIFSLYTNTIRCLQRCDVRASSFRCVATGVGSRLIVNRFSESYG